MARVRSGWGSFLRGIVSGSVASVLLGLLLMIVIPPKDMPVASVVPVAPAVKPAVTPPATASPTDPAPAMDRTDAAPATDGADPAPATADIDPAPADPATSVAGTDPAPVPAPAGPVPAGVEDPEATGPGSPGAAGATPGGTPDPQDDSTPAAAAPKSAGDEDPPAPADPPAPLADPPRQLAMPQDAELGAGVPVLADRSNPAPVAVTGPVPAADLSVAAADADSGTGLSPVTKPEGSAQVPLVPPPVAETAPVVAGAAIPPPAALPKLPARGTALRSHSAAFDLADAKPLLSILLELVPGDGADLKGILSLQLPVSFLVPSDYPDSAATAATLRAAGYEVFVRPAGQQTLAAGLPAFAVAQRLADASALVPEAVGIADLSGDLARSAALAEPALSALTGSGLAALTGGGGALGVFGRMATAAGVPHIGIERRIDDTRTPAAIATALDRAAFTARNSGKSVVLARSYPETIQSIVSWALARNNRQVTLAPASAQLLRLEKAAQ